MATTIQPLVVPLVVPLATHDDDIVAFDNGQKFTPAPEGQYAAVCCDIVDLGNVKSEYQGKVSQKHKIRIVFQLAVDNPDTESPFLVSQWFTLSMNEKATLRKFMEQWRGKTYSETEIAHGVRIAKMLGAPALLQIVHATRSDKCYANISTVMRLPHGMAVPAIDPQYVRAKDRPKDGQKNGAGGAGPGAPGTEQPPLEREDLPF